MGLNEKRVRFCGFNWSIGAQKSAHHLAGRSLLSFLVGTMAGTLLMVFSAEGLNACSFQEPA